MEVAERCGAMYWAKFRRRIDDCPNFYDVPDFCDLGIVAEYCVDSGEIQPRSLLGVIVVLDQRLERAEFTHVLSVAVDSIVRQVVVVCIT